MSVAVLAAGGIVRAAEVVALAEAAGLDLACGTVLLEKESRGGRNVWGHDPVATGGIYVKGDEVTEAAYLAYRERRAELGAQGVGPCQLTWHGFQDRADARGGCWNWPSNVAVGFEMLAGLIHAHGERDGFRRYNGSGPSAERYADDAMQRLAIWRARLAPGPDSLPTLRSGDEGLVVAALQRWLNAHDWTPPLPVLEVDGSYGPDTTAVVRAAQAQLGLTGPGAIGTPVGPRTKAAFWKAGFRL